MCYLNIYVYITQYHLFVVDIFIYTYIHYVSMAFQIVYRISNPNAKKNSKPKYAISNIHSSDNRMDFVLFHKVVKCFFIYRCFVDSFVLIFSF